MGKAAERQGRAQSQLWLWAWTTPPGGKLIGQLPPQKRIGRRVVGILTVLTSLTVLAKHVRGKPKALPTDRTVCWPLTLPLTENTKSCRLS
jgi:hypothetical protein